MAIELLKETKERLIASIKHFVADELELRSDSQAVQPRAEQPGSSALKAALLLDFILKEVGPSTYNRAVADAQARMANEIHGRCDQPDFMY